MVRMILSDLTMSMDEKNNRDKQACRIWWGACVHLQKQAPARVPEHAPSSNLIHTCLAFPVGFVKGLGVLLKDAPVIFGHMKKLDTVLVHPT